MIFFLLSLVILSLSTILSANQAMAQPESSQILISKPNGESYRPQIHTEKNNVYVVWSDGSPGNYEIFFSKSTDGGFSFDSTINLSNNLGPYSLPRMVVNDNNVYATWYDYTPGSSDVFFAKSNDNGETFETINLSKNLGPSFNPWIAASEDKVFVVWTDGTRDVIEVFGERAEEIVLEGIDVSFGIQDIFIAASQDGGINFKIFSLSDPNVESWNPRMIMHEDKIYVVWNGRIEDTVNIYFSVSKDGGLSFSEPVNVSRSSSTSTDAGLTVSGKNLYIIWKEQDSENTDIFFSKTMDDGINFIKPVNISKNGKATITRDTQISAYQDNVYVVWFENEPDGNVYFVKSDDAGDHFENTISIGVSNGTSEFSQIATYKDQVYVIWNDNAKGNFDVFLRASFDNGTTFGSIKNISNDNNDSLLFILGPQISVTEKGVYTIFEDKLDYYVGSLVLDIFTPNITPQGNFILEVKNDDGQTNANVEMNFSPTVIQPDQSVQLTLRFFDPVSREQLSDVYYSFTIIDSEGKIVDNKSSEYTEDGNDTLNVKFSKTGPVTILIDIQGTGPEKPYDVKYSGTTSLVMTVVPEFSYVAILLLGLAMAASIILSKPKWNNFPELKKN